MIGPERMSRRKAAEGERETSGALTTIPLRMRQRRVSKVALYFFALNCYTEKALAKNEEEGGKP